MKQLKPLLLIIGFAIVCRTSFAQSSFNITVNITPSSTPKKLSPKMLGLSYEKADVIRNLFYPENQALVDLFNRLGPAVLRIGGNTVDDINWEPNGPGLEEGKISLADLNRFASFIRATRWKVIYGIDFANNSSSSAVEEAAAVSKALGDRLMGFEIGNEPDMYHKQGRRSIFYTYGNFVSDWGSYAKAIKRKLPQAVFTGPGSATDAKDFSGPFARDKARDINLLTHHYYRGDGKKPTSTMDQLLAPDPKLQSDFKMLSAAAKNAHLPGGYRLTECNSYFSGGVAGISDGFGTALWGIDFMFANVINGSSGFNFHSTGGARYSPIGTNTKGTITSIRPLYYSMVIFSKVANGSLMNVSLSDTNQAFSAYAVSGTRSYQVVLNNKEDQEAVVTISLPGNASTYSSTLLTAPSINSVSGFTLGGSSIGTDGHWDPDQVETKTVTSNQVNFRVPAHSIALLKFK